MGSRTLIVGDVHGCAAELRRLLRKVRPKRLILLGDLFTRGPDPRGVWALIERWNAEAVLGNHDERVLRDWRPGERLPKRAHRWLERRPRVLEGPRWLASHYEVAPAAGRMVIYGHEARRGLVDRRPQRLGLDTGCVNGGRLSGYLVEDDRLVSVRSRHR